MKQKITLLILICAIISLPIALTLADEDKADGAKKLYEQGLTWKAEAGLVNRKSHYLNAIKAWKELLEKYPNSTRCAEVAYGIGELYESVYLREHTKAVKYYEIAIEKDPGMKKDVFYRVAYICHKKLKDDGFKSRANQAIM